MITHRPRRAVAAAAAAAGLALATAPAALASTPHTSPFADLPHVPSFALHSTSIANGRPLPHAQWSAHSKAPGAHNRSPELSWAAVPHARSYAITMYDPQSPIEGGAIQWAVANIPGSVHRIAAGAGTPRSSLLPAGATEIPTSGGPGGYLGASPLPHTGAHRYWFTVWALDTPRVKLAGGAADVGLFNFGLYEHTIARASFVCPTAAS